MHRAVAAGCPDDRETARGRLEGQRLGTAFLSARPEFSTRPQEMPQALHSAVGATAPRSRIEDHANVCIRHWLRVSRSRGLEPRREVLCLTNQRPRSGSTPARSAGEAFAGASGWCSGFAHRHIEYGSRCKYSGTAPTGRRLTGMTLHGLLVIDKPGGLTS